MNATGIRIGLVSLHRDQRDNLPLPLSSRDRHGTVLVTVEPVKRPRYQFAVSFV